MKLAILGYGNLGRGAELAVSQQPDMTLTAVFTRRDPASISPQTGVPVFPASELGRRQGEFDVLLLCGGSASDLPEMTPCLAARFDVVDSYDTHARIPEHFARVDAAARQGGHVALICGGWDPGLLSLCRLYADAVLPEGRSHTFWGPGVSQGHSEALRHLPGVLDARQYTVPVPSAVEAARNGDAVGLTARDMHRRECYVVAEKGADRDELTRRIRAMPDYFAGYETSVTFLSEEELRKNHSALSHAGLFLRSGATGSNGQHRQQIECRLRLDSNPEFTGSVLLACARAVCRMRRRGETGCKTLFDVPPADLSPLSPEKQREAFL